MTSPPTLPVDHGLVGELTSFLRDVSADVKAFKGSLQAVAPGRRYLGKRTVGQLTDCSYYASTVDETFVIYACAGAPMDLLAAETLFDSLKDAVRQSLNCRLTQTVTGQVAAPTVETADSRDCGPSLVTFANLNSVHLSVGAVGGSTKQQYATSLSIIVRLPT
jgi:hypothetical protein